MDYFDVFISCLIHWLASDVIGLLHFSKSVPRKKQTQGCAIYIVRDNIVIVVLTMCNLTLSSTLQKPNKTARCMVMKSSGLNNARAHLECVLSLHDSVY